MTYLGDIKSSYRPEGKDSIYRTSCRLSLVRLGSNARQTSDERETVRFKLKKLEADKYGSSFDTAPALINQAALKRSKGDLYI